jgi:hypothetical protein
MVIQAASCRGLMHRFRGTHRQDAFALAALAAWWRRPPDPFTFGAQVGFARKTHLDDRTVIGLWPDTGETDAGPEG